MLSEVVYCSQPIKFVDPAHTNYVCHLNMSLYALSQCRGL
jgi:hypothetical protein